MTWSFSYKDYVIWTLIFCFLKTCLIFFNPIIHILSQKNCLTFTYYNFKIHPFFFKSPIFSEMLVSNKYTDRSFWRRACRVRIAKYRPTVEPLIKVSFSQWSLPDLRAMEKVSAEIKTPTTATSNQRWNDNLVLSQCLVLTHFLLMVKQETQDIFCKEIKGKIYFFLI